MKETTAIFVKDDFGGMMGRDVWLGLLSDLDLPLETLAINVKIILIEKPKKEDL